MAAPLYSNMRWEFVGDGRFCGDGGRELQRIWSQLPWRPIGGCDGRFTCRDRSLTKLSLRQLCDMYNIAIACPVVACRPAADGVDAADAVRLRGGGGLISFNKMDGAWVHTLNTESGLVRKLLALNVINAISSELPEGARLLFLASCSMLAAIPDRERTSIAPSIVVVLRSAAAHLGARRHDSDCCG